MAKKRKRTKKGLVPKTLPVKEDPEIGAEGTLARTVLRPTVQAAATHLSFKLHGDDSVPVTALVAELGAQVKAIRDGDLSRSEAMLIAQAHALDAIFNNLARRSAANMGEYIGATETYMKLALRAQSQCRATLEALAEIKNPPNVAFVRQANIAHNQQVNNGPGTTTEGTRAGETENEQSKLLEQSDGERLDTGATGTTGKADTPLEAVGAVDRAEDRCG